MDGLFDGVPLEKIQIAETELRKIIGELPADMVKRLNSATALETSDRESIFGRAKNILTSFEAKLKQIPEKN